MQEIFIDSVTHYYGQRSILNNFFISCRVGEIVGLLGRNGSGKSTLLQVIFGNVTPHFKHLKINGEIVKKGYLSNQVGYLPQHFFIPQYMKLRDLVNLFTNKYRQDLLHVQLINENLDRQIGELSGGQRRLTECLLIIYSDYPFILLDEPFSQTSPLVINELQDHISKFASTKGFIITDHYYEQILKISTRVVLLHQGSNYAIQSKDDLRLHQYLPGN